jgi:DNA processing protein
VERLREAAKRDLDPQLEALRTHGIRIIVPTDSEYPPALKAIPDPPPYLFVRGHLTAEDELAVAIVGTRQVTDYGRGLAHKFAADFARRGVTVVSGLARGIDTAAHRGALDGGGRTIAVTACGLDIVYPSDNRDLMIEIENHGAVVSEWPPTTNPESWHFPARNRIISGLSAGVVVVEAGEKSGALITANYALEHGREVFAIPGSVYRAQSKGPHSLIKQGGALVESVDDVILALNSRSLPFEPVAELAAVEPPPAQSRPKVSQASLPNLPPAAPTALSPAESRVWFALDVEPRHLDDLAAESGLNPAEANAALVMMELKGAARRLPGNLFARPA